MMSPNWCTIAPVKYKDPHRYLKVPFSLADGVVLDAIPTWLITDKFLSGLTFVQRDFIIHAKYAMSVLYNAKNFRAPDEGWKGSETRSIQDAKKELLTLANIAIWLAKPCAFGFDVVFHVDEFETDKDFCSAESLRDIEPHLKYEKTYLQSSDLSVAKELHKIILELNRDSDVWTSIYFLWNALRETEWAVRYTLFWIALEALFGPEDGEISFRISQRIGFLLGNTRSEASDIFTKARELYKWRSKVVHGRRLSKLVNNDDEAIRISFESEMLLRDSLVKILESPTLVQNFSTNREKFLDSLAFSGTQ